LETAPVLGKMRILAGNSNQQLAEAIAAYLGEPLTGCHVRRFADLEIFVEILENVRGRDAFIIQSTSYPANDNLMELLIMIDALRRASAQRITAVIPYFGYARQDRKAGPRSPISAKLVANLITRAGADRVLTVDLHAGQIQGFFDIPTDNLFAAPTMVRDMTPKPSWSSRPTSAASCAPAPSPSASTPRSPSSTSGATGRANRK
jgi:ribose-phosphate pyrophosphokinase